MSRIEIQFAAMIKFCQNQFDRSERANEPLLGSDDGKWIFESIFAALKNKIIAAAA